MKDYLQLIDNTISYIESLIPKRRADLKTSKSKPTLKPEKVLTPKPSSFKKKAESSPPLPKKREKRKQERRDPPPPKTSFCKIASSLKGVAPNLPLLKAPPSDEKAKRIRNNWVKKNGR